MYKYVLVACEESQRVCTAKDRSKTFSGVARAMAEQWSVALLDNGDITSSNE